MRKMLKMEKVSIGSRKQEQISFLQHTNHLKINLLDIINQCKCGKKIASTLHKKKVQKVLLLECFGTNNSKTLKPTTNRFNAAKKALVQLGKLNGLFGTQWMTYFARMLLSTLKI
jgi:hypothetical protein